MPDQYFVVFIQTRCASLAEVAEVAADALRAHLARSQNWHEEGRLLMAGAFLDRPEEPVSTMAILASRADAEEYIAGDPFVIKGMTASSEIRPWANMLGAAGG